MQNFPISNVNVKKTKSDEKERKSLKRDRKSAKTTWYLENIAGNKTTTAEFVCETTRTENKSTDNDSLLRYEADLFARSSHSEESNDENRNTQPNLDAQDEETNDKEEDELLIMPSSDQMVDLLIENSSIQKNDKLLIIPCSKQMIDLPSENLSIQKDDEPILIIPSSDEMVDFPIKNSSNTQVNLSVIQDSNDKQSGDPLQNDGFENFDKTFRKLPGTTNKGHLFEDYVVAHLILNLMTDNEVVNFYLSANDQSYSSMDDIILDLKLENGSTEKYAMQLKYSNDKRATLTRGSLVNSGKNKSDKTQEAKGGFNISSYFKDYQKVSSSVGPFKFILCTNRLFNVVGDNMVIEDGTDKITVRIIQTKLELKALSCQKLDGTSCKCYKFEIIEDCSESNDIHEYRLFFDNFILVTNYMKVEDVEEQIQRTFQKNFSLKDDAYSAYLNYVKKWSAKQGKKQNCIKI